MIRAALIAAILCAQIATAAPVQWRWSGESVAPGVLTLTADGWPPPASVPVVGVSQCTGLLHVSVRGEGLGASWSIWLSALFGDALAPAFVRLLQPAQTWAAPTAHHMAGGHRVRVGVDGSAQGLAVQVDGVGIWSATFDGDCTAD
jgi:hypothetical protein